MSSSQISFRNSKLVSSLESRNFESVNSNLEFAKAKFFLTPKFGFETQNFEFANLNFGFHFRRETNHKVACPRRTTVVVDFGARKKKSFLHPTQAKVKTRGFSKRQISRFETQNFEFANPKFRLCFETRNFKLVNSKQEN